VNKSLEVYKSDIVREEGYPLHKITRTLQRKLYCKAKQDVLLPSGATHPSKARISSFYACLMMKNIGKRCAGKRMHGLMREGKVKLLFTLPTGTGTLTPQVP